MKINIQYCPTCNTKMEVYKYNKETDGKVESVAYNLYCPNCSREREVKERIIPFKKTKSVKCPCCKNKIEIQVDKSVENYLDTLSPTQLIDSLIDDVFNSIYMCPICGYVCMYEDDFDDELDDNEIDNIASDKYQSIFQSDIDNILKSWILYATLLEFYEEWLDAGICYTKAYDYIELKQLEIDPQIKQYICSKASFCFLSVAENIQSEDDITDECILAHMLTIDILRREGDFDKSISMLNLLKDTFEFDDNRFITTEETLIKMKNTKKIALYI